MSYLKEWKLLYTKKFIFPNKLMLMIILIKKAYASKNIGVYFNINIALTIPQLGYVEDETFTHDSITSPEQGH